MTLPEQIDEILFAMNRGELIVTHKDTEDLYRLAINRALGHHLIYPYKNTYKLDANGYKAIDLGGFDKWLIYNEQQKSPAPSTVNTLTFHAPVTGAIVNQDSPLRDLNDSTITTNAIPAENEKQQKAKVSMIEKWVVPIIIAIIGGVILLLIEHRTGWFSVR